MTQPDLHCIPVETDPPYNLHIGPGASHGLAAWLTVSNLGARYALVTDTNVEALHARPLRALVAEAGLRLDSVVIEAGEAGKTRATKETIEDFLIEAGCGRDSALIALGGGVVADVTGFVAATYHRGIPYVQVPTTLLAMVDASVGGKTGVDHPKGKNLIGAFHQPAAVFMDMDFLLTLPDREFRSGLAEVVKAAAIRDAPLFELIEAQAGRICARDPDLLSDLISRACRIKAEVVAADEREGDLRKILNFGHTIGHALEALSGYSMLHGEAVSVGMVVEARMAEKHGILSSGSASRIESLLAALGLPVRLPEGETCSPRAILEAARRDKKARAGRIEYAVPRALGEMARGPSGHGIPLPDRLAGEILGEMA
jgi:3-dehydroquinate synthase